MSEINGEELNVNNKSGYSEKSEASIDLDSYDEKELEKMVKENDNGFANKSGCGSNSSVSSLEMEKIAKENDNNLEDKSDDNVEEEKEKEEEEIKKKEEKNKINQFTKELADTEKIL